jgi:hypothetical protein
MPPRAARFLEQTLLWNFLIHAVALLSMALVLMPGMPGGTAPDDEARVRYIAEHPWLWRLGWLPWHLCAFIDLVTAVALVWTRWVPRLPALLTLLVTIAAVSFEQTGELSWVTRGVELARQAQETGDLGPYLAREQRDYELAVCYGASLYILMALGWTWCFAAAGTWSRTLTVLTPLTWGLLALGSVALLLPERWRPGTATVSAANGAGFVLMEVWLLLVAEQVLRRARPDESHGRLASWRHPWRNPLGRAVEAVATSRFARAVGEWLPAVGFRSDITSVLYCNYLVEAERLLPYVPHGLELQRLGPGGRYALFTFLSYRHGHFGPALLGPLRKLLPSPVQSNWRIHVRDPQTKSEGIYFITNAIDRTPHAVAARLLSEGMPMHVLHRAQVLDNPDGSFTLVLDPSAGTAPDATATLRPAEPILPPPFNTCWESYRSFLAYCVPQDRALSAQPWYGRVTRQEIALGIPLEVCEPLTGTVTSKAAQAIVGDAACVCFRVPSVFFRFDREEYDPRT